MNKVVRLTPMPSVKELLWLYKINAVKKLSQNFLMNETFINKIVRAKGPINGFEVCEVGPGPGGITRNIIKSYPSKIVVVEKDTRFKPILEALSNCSPCPFDIIYDDIRSTDMSKIFSDSLKKDWSDTPPNIWIVGNLPFSVSTPLIIDWLKDISLRKNAWAYGRVGMTLTFQEEVARRIVAPVLTKQRSRISVMCQSWCNVTYQFCIPNKSFLPNPEVDAGVVTFEPLIKPIIPFDFHLVEKVVSVIFNGRQKFVVNTIGKLFPQTIREDFTEKILKMSQINSDLRAFQVTNEEFCRICAAYKQIIDEDPRLYFYNFRGPRRKREHDWMDKSNKSKNNSENFDDSDEE